MANLINPVDLSDEVLEQILDYWYLKNGDLYIESVDEDELNLFYEIDKPTRGVQKIIKKLSELEIILCVIHWYIHTFCFLYEDELLFVTLGGIDRGNFEDYLKEELFRIVMQEKDQILAINASIR